MALIITIGVYKTRSGDRATVYRTGLDATYFPVVGTVWRIDRNGITRGLPTRWMENGRHALAGPADWDLIERFPDRPKEDAVIALGASETSSPIPEPTPDAA